MTSICSKSEFDDILQEIGEGVPDSVQYTKMSEMILEVPESSALTGMNPFLPDYKEAAMELYLLLRGRQDQGYQPDRDEATPHVLPENIWSGLAPWGFRDARLVSEHLYSWGHIFAHLDLEPGGSVLEYGPGSGQMILMLARMGYKAFGVDIGKMAIDGINAQSSHLNLSVDVECAEFGEGFEGQKFDRIIFYEAFHHAFNFDDLLIRLHDRLNPGGRIILCGEPIVPHTTPGIPFAWGPRLDALSVFCMRRFGWMELGFTHDYFMKIAGITGWSATHYPFAQCGRAAVYVLEETPVRSSAANYLLENARLKAALQDKTNTLASMYQSTSWRVSKPLRDIKKLLRNIR
ncbi:class I SAM-dependent methyltransferase [Acetobacter fallax]|uniref:Methyltransferase domain-containing protein n=1 Tax=Acetobacter fallax TaxID=1737473 RepID=A0ABX0KF14_9PROT|nr:class I SAM-dependent methyltransferase [Acetobacter fallax]NHO33000.1 methyltransferase domain-containing protein [Acetobacter fallax]NHO36631.1 methyltransferase domain-containing protein [Acetobacter fallax]